MQEPANFKAPKSTLKVFQPGSEVIVKMSNRQCMQFWVSPELGFEPPVVILLVVHIQLWLASSARP